MMVNTNGVTIKVNAACWRELTVCIVLFVLSRLHIISNICAVFPVLFIVVGLL